MEWSGEEELGWRRERCFCSPLISAFAPCPQGYPAWKGERLTADQLWDLFQGLEGSNLVAYSHLLTGDGREGFVSVRPDSSVSSLAPSLLASVCSLASLNCTHRLCRIGSVSRGGREDCTSAARGLLWPSLLPCCQCGMILIASCPVFTSPPPQINKDLVYVCDPVMGDNGKLYVPEGLVQVYREKVLPEATVITPNFFEAELLTGIKVASIEDAYAAANKLHTMGIETVIITSMDIGWWVGRDGLLPQLVRG